MDQQLKSFSELGIIMPPPAFEGEKIEPYKILGQKVTILKYEVRPSKYKDKGCAECLYLQIEIHEKKRLVFLGSGALIQLFRSIPQNKFPFIGTIVKDNGYRII